jgi:DNA-binding GntR family transcriptional regulator
VPAPRAQTLQEQIYHQIRADILHGRIAPGTRLKAVELCRQYDVSLSVVREALTRLVEQRLVERQAQQSFAVISVSAERLTDLTMLRINVETLALQRAIERGDLAWEGRVLAAQHLLAHTPSRDPPGSDQISIAWTAAHAAFHATLIEACSSPLLTELCRSLFDASELYRRWSLRAKRALTNEHSAIVQAVLARDSERATSLLARHFQRTADVVLDSLREAGPREGPSPRPAVDQQPAVNAPRTRENRPQTARR